MPEEQEERAELSSDEEFSAALDLSVALYEEGAFEIRPWSWGVDIAVDDDMLESAIPKYGLGIEDYRRILDRELDVLLTAEILGVPDDRLADAPPLRGIDEEGLKQLCSRRERVRALFPIGRFVAELRAKRDCVASILAGMTWEITRSDSSSAKVQVAPVALLRFTSTVRELVSMPADSHQTSDVGTMMLALGQPESHLFGCTLSDVDHLIRQLRAVRERLADGRMGDADG